MSRPPTMTKGRLLTMLGGMGVVTTGLGAWWFGMRKYQVMKEQRDPNASESLPTWEYRIYQARNPEDNADNPATLRNSPADSKSSSAAKPPAESAPQNKNTKENSGEQAKGAVPEAPQSKKGESSSDKDVGPAPTGQPTPQRQTDSKEGAKVVSKASQ